mmetsp:Transcript_11900/g.16121  ORF Transcript_11900/g.16121 Transcript_11900/m.16121 type:complete len:229 (+) Transcript_11900:125-811(+)
MMMIPLMLYLSILSLAFADDGYGCVTSDILNVRFGEYEVNCGTTVPYSTAHYSNEPPVITYKKADKPYYVVAMVDPDAPSSSDPTYREVRHYLVGNVPIEIMRDIGTFNTTSTIISDFVNPSPPNASGYHRYVQFVYEQPDENSINFEVLNSTITNFNISAFADSYNLTLVASNYFVTQYECSSDYTQCGKQSMGLVDCCSDGFDCYEQNAYYYQCLPGNQTTIAMKA